jgi:hypothetical protein
VLLLRASARKLYNHLSVSVPSIVCGTRAQAQAQAQTQTKHKHNRCTHAHYHTHTRSKRTHTHAHACVRARSLIHSILSTAALSTWVAYTSHTTRTLLASSPPSLLITSSLPFPYLGAQGCTGGYLIQSPLALAPCSTCFLLLSHTLSLRQSTFPAVTKQRTGVSLRGQLRSGSISGSDYVGGPNAVGMNQGAYPGGLPRRT